MFGGIDPKQMKAMMQKMGIKQENIDAKRVIFELDDKNIVIDEPQVVKIMMQGQESWQITGEAREESGISEDDIKQVMEKTGKSKEEAKEALEQANGDLAEAILNLS